MRWAMSDNLRERALAAAKVEADQKAHERAQYEKRVEQWEAELIAAAEAAAEEVLGVHVPFSIYTGRDSDGVENGERAACAGVEGVRITFRRHWRRGNEEQWKTSSSGTVLASLQ